MTAEALAIRYAIDVLGWALFHSLWQDAVVALGAAGLLALLKGRSASGRYLTAYGGLLLMALLPVATAWRLTAGPAAVAAAGPAAVAAAQQPFVDPALFWTGVARLLDPLLPWAVAVWFAGVLAMSVRLAGGYAVVRGLGRRGAVPPDDGWRRRFSRLVERLGIRRRVDLLASTRVVVPMVYGWLRPVVLVPLGALTALPVEQVESILAHELAHVRRHDYLMNLVQSVVEILLFYHPATWWLSARVRAERENCCDDVAVAVAGDSRVYVHALATLAELRAAPGRSPALAVTGSPLVERIRRLVLPRRETSGEAGSRLAASVLLLSLALVLGIGVATRAEAAAAVVLGLEPSSHLTTTRLGYRDELRVAGSCGPTEEVVRCLDAAGEVRLECAEKSPLAMLWQSLRGRSSDDEVRVAVRRKAPGRSAVPPRAQDGPSDLSTVERLVVTGDLPRCVGR